MQDDMTTVISNKAKIKDKINHFESEIHKFKNELEERHTNTEQLLAETRFIKQHLKEEMVHLQRDLYEEIIVQNERIVELGQQIYSSKLFTERKFSENADLDIRIRTNTELIRTAETKLAKLKQKVSNMKHWSDDTEIHLKKYHPLHLATFVFDQLYQQASSAKEKQQLKDRFGHIFAQMERNAQDP